MIWRDLNNHHKKTFVFAEWYSGDGLSYKKQVVQRFYIWHDTVIAN